MIAANDSAARTSQIVVSRLAMPPREKSWSIAALPLLLDEPGRHRGVDPLDADGDRPEARLVDECLHHASTA